MNNDQETLFDARPALTQIWRDAFFKHSEWMHFHELAMSDPFQAESQAQAFCSDIAQKAHTTLRELGVTDKELGIHTVGE